MTREELERPLWESDHPYYAQEGNYYSNGEHAEYESWSDFMDEMGDADLDMNLVYRWDWREGDDWGIPPGESRLMIFWIGQRKARAFSSEVAVTRDDEPAIRAWLRPRLARLMELWSPLTPTKESARG